MGMGNFMGGVFQGGLKTWEMFQQDDKLKMEREKADRESYDFNKRKGVDDKLVDIAGREAAAQTDSNFANDGTASDALAEQAINYNVGDVANNDPADPSQTPTAPIKEEDKAAIRKAYDPKNYTNKAQLAIDGAEAKIRNTAVDNANESNPDGFSTDDMDNAVTPEARTAITKQYGGMRPDELNQYRFSMERAKAYEAAGDWKTAKELKASAESDASGSFISAVIGRDRNKALALYNLYPNGHDLQDLRFAPNGDVIITDGNGEKVIPQYDAIASSMALMKPEQAATMVMNKYKNDENMQRVLAAIQGRNTAAVIAADAKVTVGAGHDAVRIAGGPGRSGTGSGKGGKLAGYDDDQYMGYAAQELKDAIGQDGQKLPTLKKMDIQNSVQELHRNHPEMSPNDVLLIAMKASDHPDLIKPYVQPNGVIAMTYSDPKLGDQSRQFIVRNNIPIDAAKKLGMSDEDLARNASMVLGNLPKPALSDLAAAVADPKVYQQAINQLNSVPNNQKNLNTFQTQYNWMKYYKAPNAQGSTAGVGDMPNNRSPLTMDQQSNIDSTIGVSPVTSLSNAMSKVGGIVSRKAGEVKSQGAVADAKRVAQQAISGTVPLFDWQINGLLDYLKSNPGESANLGLDNKTLKALQDRTGKQYGLTNGGKQ